ncbi:MAG: MarR family transcriptional regulator [Pedosphaera sp.]|nr:MarR family transcriptional regulator [Pedosphaera sp.]
MRPLAPPSEVDHVRLIGDLVSKGITCSPALRTGKTMVGDGLVLEATNPAERILHYLRKHDGASPAELRAVLGLSRSSAYRALQRLLEASQVETTGGRTTAAGYRISNFDPSRN